MDKATVKELVSRAIGPAPWYWDTFPSIRGASGAQFIWKFHGTTGPHGYLVSLGRKDKPLKRRIVVNTYTRAFLVPPFMLGLWFSDKNMIQIACFDPEDLPGFALSELPKGFKDSHQPYYASGEPNCLVSIDPTLPEGTHKKDFPQALGTVEELLIIVNHSYEHSYQDDEDTPAHAIFEVQPSRSQIKVMPQKWFTANQFDVGYQWITRVTRNPETGKLIGDGIRIGIFQLTEDGCQLEYWIEKKV